MSKVKSFFFLLRQRGPAYIGRRVFLGDASYPAIANYKLVKKLFKGKTGIEIGGPSGLFEKKQNYAPIYNIIKSLDNCNFSGSTIWEGNISSGKTFHYDNGSKTGTQYIADATDVSSIPKKDYEFLLSSNCLEHIANPLKAVKQWMGLLKPGGLMLLVLPNKDFCFDHNRPVTLFSHLLDDYNKNTQEDDLTHLDEILALHDLAMDLPAGTPEQFKARSLKNFENRALHHHVFDIPLLEQIMNYYNMDILLTSEGPMNTIIGRKKN